LGKRLGMMMKSRSNKKRHFVQNGQNIDLVDKVFEELVSDKSFIETCNLLRTHFEMPSMLRTDPEAYNDKSRST
jgi:hypothetical protein